MNVLINPFRYAWDKDLKASIERILEQLKDHNYAHTSDGNASRQFARTIPRYYRRNNIVIFSNKVGTRGKKVISIKPEYCIIQEDETKFRIKLRE